MEETGTTERSLQEWLNLRSEVRRLSRKLRAAQERLRVLESNVPWLGGVKGTLRKKDGEKAEVPEGPRPRRPDSPSPAPPASGSRTQSPPRQERETREKKRKAGPLLVKAQREAEEKRRKLQRPATPKPSPVTPQGRTHIVDASEMSLQALEELLRSRRTALRAPSWSEESEGTSRDVTREGED
jgi:hypothetical protein